MDEVATMQVLEIIRTYIKERGFAPSIRDIQKLGAIPSTSIVRRYLDRLEDSGYIERTPDTARSIVLTTIGQPGADET